jgi:hypothetical protein
MQIKINGNNRRRSRHDVISNPRRIVPIDHYPIIHISSVEELERVHGEKGRNWIALISKEGPRYSVYDMIVCQEPNPLIFRAMLLGIRFEHP